MGNAKRNHTFLERIYERAKTLHRTSLPEPDEKSFV